MDPSRGDAIYVPNGWWHSVEALEASVSISGRGLSLCEGLSFLPYWLALLLRLYTYEMISCT